MFVGCESVHAHLKKEEGWFYQYMRYVREERAKEHERDFEKRQDGVSDSCVALVHGHKAFNRLVIAQSYQQPVVIKLFSPQSLDSIKIKSIYQEVAESLNNKVAFIAMDIIENNDIFVQIMAACRLTQVALPLFLFYKDGYLYTPHHELSPIVQGYLTKENLENFIKHKFEIKSN
jgi:thiol-disulfide isomerase/thioredoxin